MKTVLCCALVALSLPPAAAQAPFPGGGRPGGRPNRPPTLDVSGSWNLESGMQFDMDIHASDPDGDPVRIRADTLPDGARLEMISADTARLTWTPSRGQAGDHRVRVSADDGIERTEREVTLRVDEEWESYLLPGFRYTAWLPTNRGRYGIFHGPSVEFLFAAWIHRNENRGPSHGRVFGHIDLLFSDQEDVSEALIYSLGTTLSVERNPRRRVLVPYFGLEFGGLYQAEHGNIFQLQPLLGLHLWSTQNQFLNLEGGYLFPTHELEQLRGWRATLGLDFSLW